MSDIATALGNLASEQQKLAEIARDLAAQAQTLAYAIARLCRT